MRLRVRALMHEHRLEPPEPCIVPMMPPTAGAQIVEGFASTCDIDADRCRFRPFAFGMLRKVPLLLKHDPKVIAGEIEALSYDASGNLKIRARVDHPLARRCKRRRRF